MIKRLKRKTDLKMTSSFSHLQIFFKKTFFKQIFQCTISVNQFEYRSGLTKCQAYSVPKLFIKGISMVAILTKCHLRNSDSPCRLMLPIKFQLNSGRIVEIMKRSKLFAKVIRMVAILDIGAKPLEQL